MLVVTTTHHLSISLSPEMLPTLIMGIVTTVTVVRSLYRAGTGLMNYKEKFSLTNIRTFRAFLFMIGPRKVQLMIINASAKYSKLKTKHVSQSIFSSVPRALSTLPTGTIQSWAICSIPFETNDATRVKVESGELRGKIALSTNRPKSWAPQ